jgi:hypothetical protein
LHRVCAHRTAACGRLQLPQGHRRRSVRQRHSFLLHVRPIFQEDLHEIRPGQERHQILLKRLNFARQSYSQQSFRSIETALLLGVSLPRYFTLCYLITTNLQFSEFCSFEFFRQIFLFIPNAKYQKDYLVIVFWLQER